MTTKLILYNETVALLGQLKFTEKPRLVLNDFYAEAQQHCLEQGLWSFALRVSTETSDTTATVGYAKVFNKPSDWIRTAMVSGTATFTEPIHKYEDEGSVIRAEVTTLYLKYVSNDASYGLNLAKWPQLFSDYFVAHLAREACLRITRNGALLGELGDREKLKLAAALKVHAMEDGNVDESDKRCPQIAEAVAARRQA